MDSIPLVAITGQVAVSQIGRDVFQEADITGAAEPFTKYSYLVKDASIIPKVMKEAFYIAATGRPGPVLVDIPVDIQQSELDFCYPEQVRIRGYKPPLRGHAGQIERVASALRQARRPLLCAGGGVILAGAQPVLRSFCEAAGVPVVTTLMGLGALPGEHPLHLGMVGVHGTARANRALRETELLLIVGARISDRAIAAAGRSPEAPRLYISTSIPPKSARTSAQPFHWWGMRGRCSPPCSKSAPPRRVKGGCRAFVLLRSPNFCQPSPASSTRRR